VKVLFTLIFLFLASEFILLSQIENFLGVKKEIILQNHKSTVTNEFKVIVNILKDLSQNTFRGFINKPAILKAIEQKNREKLYKLLKKDYSYLKQLGFMQVHFHLPNNNSFLRMHQPHKYGDDLTNARYSVAFTNKYKRFIEGLESGRVVPGYRFVYPLFLNNKHIGSVELSFSINKIVNEIEKVYKTHTHFLINKKVFSQKVFEEFQHFYMSSIEHPDYVKLNRKYLNRIETWYTDQSYKNAVEDGLLTKQPFSFELDIMHGNNSKHKHKVVTFLPIMNIEKTDLSYFVFYSDSKDLQFIEEEELIAKIIGSIILLLIFVVAFVFYQHRESIIKSKNTLQIFNDTLEKNVANKTKQLNELNQHLEEINRNLELKIEQEVSNNREKDIQLFLQSKKASMGEMVGAIAHQWRQPLNELAIRIQKLKYDYIHENISEEYLDNFIQTNKKTINFMSQTVDGFRNFFRIDKEKTDFPVKATMEEVILMLNAQLEHFSIETRIIGTDFTHYGFKTEFQQVILNIINNAKDTFVENSTDKPTITFVIRNNHIIISDNGGGVPLRIEYKIFDPYFTTKEEGKGTGMGLYMSKIIIEDNMKGKLYLENTKSGASFHIEL